MSGFVAWIYGAEFMLDSSLDEERCFDHWYLGQQIGSPKYQNMVMRYISVRALPEVEFLDYISFNTLDSDTFSHLWAQADLSPISDFEKLLG